MSDEAKAQRIEFDVMIGRLDRCLSEFLDSFSITLDEPDRQTLKHHADDLIGVGNSMLDKLRPTPERVKITHAAHCSVYLPMDRTCDCGTGVNHE